MLIRFRHELLGGHVHVRVFAGKGSLSLAKAGDLVFNEEEWAAFIAELDRRPPGGVIEVVPESA